MSLFGKLPKPFLEKNGIEKKMIKKKKEMNFNILNFMDVKKNYLMILALSQIRIYSKIFFMIK